MKKINKAKRKLSGFSFKNGHVAMTDASQGGPNSMLDAFVFKAALMGDPTEEQKQIFTDLGIDISKSNNQSANAGDIQKGKDIVSKQEEINKALEDQIAKMAANQVVMQKALRKATASQTISQYGLGDDISGGLADAVSNLTDEDGDAVFKALAAIKATPAESVLGKPPADDTLSKSLTSEVGVSGKAEEDATDKELSVVAKAKARSEQLDKGEIQ